MGWFSRFFGRSGHTGTATSGPTPVSTNAEEQLSGRPKAPPEQPKRPAVQQAFATGDEPAATCEACGKPHSVRLTSGVSQKVIVCSCGAMVTVRRQSASSSSDRTSQKPPALPAGRVSSTGKGFACPNCGKENYEPHPDYSSSNRRCRECLTVFSTSHIPSRADASNATVGRSKESRAPTTRPFRPVSSSRAWKCPRCGVALEKGLLNTLAIPGQNADLVVGVATCLGCNATFEQSDVYAGIYDITAARVSPTAKSTSCCQCGARVHAASEFDMTGVASRTSAIQAGLGFQCVDCGAAYCFTCISSAATHVVTRGKACPQCRGPVDVLKLA